MSRRLICLSLFFYSLLIIVVLLLPPSIFVQNGNSRLIEWAYYITMSGGWYGSIGILVLTSFFYTVRVKKTGERIYRFFRSFFALGLFLALFALINENVTKTVVRFPRPSHIYILKESGSEISIDSLYGMTGTERRKAIGHIVAENRAVFEKIDPRILGHWVDEAGFSFPSGHAFNAFLLAVILAFSIQNIRSYPALRKFAFVPLCWAACVAISRVLLNVHMPLDVFAGAGLGLTVGLLFLYFDRTRALIIHKV